MIETILGQMYHQFQLSWWERWQNVKFLTTVTLIILGFSKKRKTTANTFYNLWDLPAFGREIRKLIFFHNKMARVILDPKHKGIKAWEYGLFLSSVLFKKGMKVLDVGSGGSVLPLYLTKKAVKVTAFDLEKPQEKPNQQLLNRFLNVSYEHGSMLKLPFKDNSFDLVLSISAIEHLNNNKPTSKQVIKALTEMIRVLKPKGRLFITSDIYFPNLQRWDRYSQNFGYKGIRAVFRRDQFETIFLRTLDKLNCHLIGPKDFNFEAVLEDINRSNYRGQFFTSFAIDVQKKA